MISARIKAALGAAKRRGVVLGGYRGHAPTRRARARAAKVVTERADARARDIMPTIRALQGNGATSLSAVARGLNEAGIPTARASGKWSAKTVSNVLSRVPA